MTHFYVTCDEDKQVDRVDVPVTRIETAGLMNRLKRWFNLDSSVSDDILQPENYNDYICGYVGFWVMADEAHITTIAVREELLRRGIGELLLLTVLNRARELYANVVTLEVRVSNTGAQNLYLKYGFKQVGVRKAYYTDNREDAYIMTTGDITSSECHTQMRELHQAHTSRWGEARFSFSID
ncbi:MAG: ribosomal protein S18-alanine N-acetyltransferase [Dehalococcoidales bacterium]|nr:MAG: ribosomal protein S18-alanine N-acetyltransferase [Dehalococcoidales bacterium]